MNTRGKQLNEREKELVQLLMIMIAHLFTTILRLQFQKNFFDHAYG